MQRKRPIADVSLYSCPPRIHLDPDFQIKSVMSYLMQSEKYKDENLAREKAAGIVERCRKATRR